MPTGCFGPWGQDADFFNNFLKQDSAWSAEILILYPAVFAKFNTPQTWSITLSLCLLSRAFERLPPGH